MALGVPSPVIAGEGSGHDLLRFSTAGSVDDGKSTLIGRLLYETKQIFDDQLAAIERTSKQQGAEYLNLALLTDGLRAEREQGITIDVAYRYFATPRRKFIIADTPGHVQYTRNMVTGASTAGLALILVDARNGVVEQSRRHAVLSSLLGVARVVVCINKMDLTNYDRDVYERLKAEFSHFVSGLDFEEVRFIPISALHGDNVVSRSENMAWYDGATLLDYLETVPTTGSINSAAADLRFPVQYVIRPHSHRHHDYRAYAGQVASGTLRPGEPVVVLPAGLHTRVHSIDTFEGPLSEAAPPLSVALRLEDDVDVSRGDMICRPGAEPRTEQQFEAMLCWLAATPLSLGKRYVIQHTTRTARALVPSLEYGLDVNTLGHDPSASTLRMNEIGQATIKTSQPLFVDPYRANRATGSFILIDEGTSNTVAAGMVL